MVSSWCMERHAVAWERRPGPGRSAGGPAGIPTSLPINGEQLTRRLPFFLPPPTHREHNSAAQWLAYQARTNSQRDTKNWDAAGSSDSEHVQEGGGVLGPFFLSFKILFSQIVTYWQQTKNVQNLYFYIKFGQKPQWLFTTRDWCENERMTVN